MDGEVGLFAREDNPDLEDWIYASCAEIWRGLSVPYQIVDAMMAQSLQEDAGRNHPLFAWIVMDDVPEYLGAVVARLVTDAPTPYILLAQTLAEIHASLPPGLIRSPLWGLYLRAKKRKLIRWNPRLNHANAAVL
jgi:hypothetical protein